MTPERIVVIGSGMVGSRFVTDLDAALRRTGRTAAITAIGDEPHAPYNRVLLSDVLAGRADLGALTLPTLPAGVRELRGVRVHHLDRGRREVVTEQRERIPYDLAVLATGARARVPALPGLREYGRPAHGVRVLRTLDDARGIIAAAAVSERIAILGGGVLGVEIAVGLRARGVEVVLVHAGGAPMDRQLDPASAAVLAATLRDRGIEVVVGAGVVSAVRTGRRVRGLALADGNVVTADAVVVAAGIEPRTELAATAGLTVDRGIVVGTDLASVTDDRITAIGDCAQPPGGLRGLVGPGWEQARALAARIAGEPLSPRSGQDDVVRLKAGPVSAVGIGDPGLLAEDGGLRVLALHDPGGRRSIRIATDGGRLRAASCVGAPVIAAELQLAFERGLPLPADPAHLLIDRSLVAPTGDGASLTRIPDTATLCRCNGVTKGQIIASYRSGARTVAEVAAHTRATTGCGGCTGEVSDAIAWLAGADPDQSSSPGSAPVPAPAGGR